jgi:hypothetical protein
MKTYIVRIRFKALNEYSEVVPVDRSCEKGVNSQLIAREDFTALIICALCTT